MECFVHTTYKYLFDVIKPKHGYCLPVIICCFVSAGCEVTLSFYLCVRTCVCVSLSLSSCTSMAFQVHNWFLLYVSLLLCDLTSGQPPDTLSFYSYTPESSSVQGGTVLSITGDGFQTSSTKCQLEHPNYGSEVVDDCLVSNSTHMVCTLPSITFLPDLSLVTGGFNVSLLLIDTPERSEQTYNFIVYDQSAAEMSWMDPSWGYNNSETKVEIYGSGFVNTGGITCVVNDKFNVLASFVNSSLIECRLPPYPMTAQVVIAVLMNGQSVSLVEVTDEEVSSFIYYSTPPVIDKSSFGPSYASLVIEFDREVEVGGESYNQSGNPQDGPNCGSIFTSTTLGLIGKSSLCSWKNTLQDAIIIELSTDSAVVPDSILHFRSDVLRTRHTAYSKHASGSIIVEQNAAPLEPIAVVTGPQYIPHCGSFVLSGSSSQNSGYRPLLYQWNINETSLAEFTSGSGEDMDEGAMMPMVEPLDDLLMNGFTNLSSITLLSESFATNVVYTITMTVQNFLGLEDERNVTLVKLPLPVPLVTLSGGDVQVVYANTDFHLHGEAEIPACNNTEGVVIHFTYNWTISFDGKIYEIPGSVTNSSALLIPANSLVPNTSYLVMLDVHGSGQSGNASTVLHALPSEIEARIFGGNSLTYSQGEPIILEASYMEEIATLHDKLTLSWTCFSVDGGPEAPCLDSINGNVLSIPGNLSHELPPGTLSPGRYRLTLTLAVKETNVSNTAVQTLHVLNHSAPQAFLQWPQFAGEFPVQQKLIIDGLVRWHSNGAIEWECVYRAGE